MKQSTKFVAAIVIAFGAGLASYKVISPIAKSILGVNESPKWDYVDNAGGHYGKDFKEVKISSSVDSSDQRAYFLQSTSTEPM